MSALYIRKCQDFDKLQWKYGMAREDDKMSVQNMYDINRYLFLQQFCDKKGVVSNLASLLIIKWKNPAGSHRCLLFLQQGCAEEEIWLPEKPGNKVRTGTGGESMWEFSSC